MDQQLETQSSSYLDSAIHARRLRQDALERSVQCKTLWRDAQGNRNALWTKLGLAESVRKQFRNCARILTEPGERARAARGILVFGDGIAPAMAALAFAFTEECLDRRFKVLHVSAPELIDGRDVLGPKQHCKFDDMIERAHAQAPAILLIQDIEFIAPAVNTTLFNRATAQSNGALLRHLAGELPLSYVRSGIPARHRYVLLLGTSTRAHLINPAIVARAQWKIEGVAAAPESKRRLS